MEEFSTNKWYNIENYATKGSGLTPFFGVQFL